METPATGNAELDLLVQEIAELRPLPSVALRVLKIAESEHFSAHELAQAIGTDAALTAKMLRLANSAYYGFPRRISTVRDAVVLLGFRAVRSATLATCVIDTMPHGEHIDDRAFWHFSITVAMLAEVLARSARRHTDEAYTAGVLHNIGRLALDQHRPEMLRRAMLLAEREEMTLVEAEHALLGFTDAQVGGALALHWNFPPELAAAVAEHQQPIESLVDRDSLAALVVRARDFARGRGMTDGVEAVLEQEPDRGWLIAPIAPVLAQAGGIEGVIERAAAFIDQTMGPS
ncbi:MAG: HDOD domain-containing protein [Chloroflexota bacterium]